LQIVILTYKLDTFDEIGNKVLLYFLQVLYYTATSRM